MADFGRSWNTHRRSLTEGGRISGRAAPDIAAHFVASGAVNEHLRRVRYPGWTFSGACVQGAEDVVEVIAFHAGGEGGKELIREPATGCWRVPSDASSDEVRAIVLAAVVAIDGPEAEAEFEWREG